MKSLKLYYLILLVLFVLIWACEITGPEPVPINLFYITENKITFKCTSAKPGDKGVLNGFEFEAVDNALLRQRRDENADMSKLCTSLVTDMNSLIKDSNLNQLIGKWEFSKVTDMSLMFYNSSFNQPIGDWDVGKLRDMGTMFWHNQHFNQDLSKWCVDKKVKSKGDRGSSIL